MSFKPYPKYKASGVEWLGDVPEAWGQKRLAYLFQRKKDVNHIDEELLSVYRDYGVIPKSSRDDNFNKPSEDLSPYQLVNSGDLVLNKMKTWQGSIAISEYRGIVSPAYFVAAPRVPMHRRYMHHLLRCPQYIAEYRKLSGGVRPNQWDLNYDHFKNIPALLPSDFEQASIATFLDRETAKIDTLIVKQEAMIELLKEKRQAVISLAVTKGLDPSVPMKASGVEWLGEVPEHWNATRLKFVASFITSGPRGWSDYLTDEGPIFLQSGDLNDELGIDFRLTKRVTPPANAEGRRTTLNELDIVVCITGANTGRVAVVVGMPCAAFINQHLALVRPMRTTVSPKFLAYLLASDIGKTYFEVSQYGLKEGLSLSAVSEAPIPSLPLDEQNSIVAFIDMTTAKIDTLIAKAQQAIALQKEHRTALISAAVTGKIDVRERVVARQSA